MCGTFLVLRTNDIDRSPSFYASGGGGKLETTKYINKQDDPTNEEEWRGKPSRVIPGQGLH